MQLDMRRQGADPGGSGRGGGEVFAVVKASRQGQGLALDKYSHPARLAMGTRCLAII